MTDDAPPPCPAVSAADIRGLTRALFASTPDALVVLDAQGRVALMNPAFERLWGFPPELLARRDTTEVRRFIAARLKNPQAYLDGLPQLHATPPAGRLDEVERLDGRILERHVWPLDQQGLPGAVVARWRDVTALRQAERRAQAAQARLQALFEHATDAILLADDHGTYLDANPAACDLLGRPREALRGLGIGDVVAMPAEQRARAWQQFLAAGRAQGEVTLRRPDGQLRVAHFSAVAHIQPGVHLSILRDVTDSVRERQRAREVATQMDMAAAHASLVFFIVDLREATVVLSDPDWAQHLLGHPPGQVAAHPDALDELVHPDDRALREAAWQAHLAGHSPTYECEFRIRHADGHWLWLLARGRAVERDDAGRALRVAGVRIDITRRKQAELALQQQAYTDGLTGVLTRRRFLELAAIEWDRARRHGQPVALLMIDLDHFKTVNDRWGHAGGDAVLRAFAATAGEVLRGSDLLGRVGGEEFAVLLPQTDRAGAVVLAHRLQQLVRASPVVLAQGLAGYTVSIGVAAAEPGAPGDVEALMLAADDALYRAKGQGRDRVLLAGDAP
jgi:diguanylate cyclase (GGDEF)-like protein/PAS domain S-box-containing protein